MNELASSLLGARFDVGRPLGEGAMSVVYEAVDRATKERVAVKVLRARDPESQAHFKREFRAVTGVRHPNLVRLHELFEAGDLLCFTMDLVEGRDLLAHVRTGGEPASQEPTFQASHAADVPDGRASRSPAAPAFDEERLRSVVAQLTRALAALHDDGLVHRDVKPSNIIVTEGGTLRLLDYGLVAELARLRVTAPAIVGTAAYMAPEQTSRGPVGPATDLYAMGVVLFEALTGDLPFRGLAPEVMSHKCLFDAPPPRALAGDLPADLDVLCTRLLARDPRARPSAAEVASALGFDLRAT